MHFSIAYYYITISVSHQTQSLHKPLLNANRSKEERGSWDAPLSEPNATVSHWTETL